MTADATDDPPEPVGGDSVGLRCHFSKQNRWAKVLENRETKPYGVTTNLFIGAGSSVLMLAL